MTVRLPTAGDLVEAAEKCVSEDGTAQLKAALTGSAIRACVSVQQPGWLDLREALWPHSSSQEHLAEMAEFLRQPGRYVQFVCYSGSGVPVGMIEASMRTDYVNGTESSPVAFLEGIFVAADCRRRGIAAGLVRHVAEWAARRGCEELASDAQLENEAGRAVHKALGFSETERVVFFTKRLR